MKVKHADVVKLLKDCGCATADKWPEKRLADKLAKLPALIEKEEIDPKSADSKALLKKIIAAINKEDKIEITGIPGEASSAKEEVKPAKDSKKAAAKAAKEDEEDEEEDSDDEEESDDDDEDEEEDSDDDEESDEEESDEEDSDEEEEEDDSDDEEEEDESEDDDEEEEDDDEEEASSKKKSKKDKKKEGKKGKAPPKSAGGEGKPGVIASIVEFLSDASRDKPLSKKKLVEKLSKRFPDRDAESMSKTVNVQVPNRIKKDKKLNVVKTDKGYYIEGKLKT